MICFMLWIAAGVCARIGAQEPARPQEPDAKKEKEDLGERLIRKAVTDQDEDMMDVLIRLMDESATRLELEFDPGEQTQDVQGRIVRQLDEVIQQAASRTQAKSRSSKPSQGEKRGSTKPDTKSGRDGATRPGQPAAGSDPPESTERGTAAGGTDPDAGTMRDVRRTWGHLPQRERDEVIQGITERHLERFREWIERYYQALQEADE